VHRYWIDLVLCGMGSRMSEWAGREVCVLGLGVAGYSMADALMQLGATVIVLDEGGAAGERAEILRTLGVAVHTNYGGELPACDLVVTSPGLPPSHAFLQQAQRRGVTVWGEVELAWHLRDVGSRAPWLVITGTNGKTTTTLMLQSILAADGLKAIAAGNIGVPLVDVVMHEKPDVIAVEISSHQLPFMFSVQPQASVCLNIASDHLDHFGTMERYVTTKARIYQNTERAAIYNVQDPVTEHMVREADVIEGCRAIGFTLGVPEQSMVGVVQDLLVDRAFESEAVALAPLDAVHPLAPHNVANALAAAALARSHGVRTTSVEAGLRSFTPAGHRLAHVAEIAGVDYVNDSKATNTHAAQTAMAAFPSVVWIGGGVAKDQDFDAMLAAVAPKLRGAVLIGVDQGIIASAIERHAPAIPVIRVEARETDGMDAAVQAAASLARPGDTVLLAPGCASWDMFSNYSHRGDVFVSSVQALAARR